MRAKVFLVVSVLVLGAFVLASGQNIFVDVSEIQGLDENGLIPPEGCDLVIPVRFTNTGEARSCISNGFQFTSDGITFTGIEGAWNPAYPWNLEMAVALMQFPPYFDVGLYTNYFDNGVGFAGLSNMGSGLPAFFDDVAYYITLAGLQGNLGDGWLIMDSTFWLPANVWLWCSEPTVYPDWGGPYEFVLYELPCRVERGDINASGGDPDIADITRLIDYLYLSHSPICYIKEADINNSGGEPDMADITRLIDFLYLSRTPIDPMPGCD